MDSRCVPLKEAANSAQLAAIYFIPESYMPPGCGAMSEDKESRRTRKTEDGERTDVISWGREARHHDHEAVEVHKDGDVDYFIGTHKDKKKR